MTKNKTTILKNLIGSYRQGVEQQMSRFSPFSERYDDLGKILGIINEMYRLCEEMEEVVEAI